MLLDNKQLSAVGRYSQERLAEKPTSKSPRGFLRCFMLLLVLSCLSVTPVFSAPKGLHVVILGDSNTSIGGDDCTDSIGWTRWFAERFRPETCKSYARSGATWTNTSRTRYDIVENVEVLSDNNVIYNQMNRLFADCEQKVQVIPDVILIAAGTNDAWFSNERPGIFSRTVEQVYQSPFPYGQGLAISSVVSLAGSVRLVCDQLMAHFPDAQIVILTPMQTVKASFEKIRKVGNILEECAHRMSVPIIRQDFLTGVYPNRETRRKEMTSDGTHTSVKGAQRNGYLIANQLRSLLCY